MALTHDDILRVARLARLDLAPEELPALARDLAAILDYVAELNELDTRAVPPTRSIAADQAPLRADQHQPGLGREAALSEAPRRSDDAFAVPAFVDEP